MHIAVVFATCLRSVVTLTMTPVPDRLDYYNVVPR